MFSRVRFPSHLVQVQDQLVDRRHFQATPMAVPAVAGAWDVVLVVGDARVDQAGPAGTPAGAAAPAGARDHSVGERIWIKKWYC